MEASSEVIQDRTDRKPRLLLIAGAAISAAGVLCFLNSPTPEVVVWLVGAVTLAVLCWAVLRTSHQHFRVLCALAVIDIAIQISYMSGTTRAVAHYGLVALFCFPLLPAAWSARAQWRGGFRLYACYLGWAAVTLLYSLAPKFSAGRLLDAVAVVSVLTLVSSEVNDREASGRILAQLLIAFGVMTAVVAASLVVLPRSLTWTLPDGAQPGGAILRFSGILGNPNDVGELMLLTVGTGAAYWPRANGKWKLAIGFTALVALICGALADSRTPFLALTVGAVAWMFWKYRARAILIVACLGLIAVGAILGSGSLNYLERGNVATLTGRTEIWTYIISQIKARPLLGYGYEVGGAIYQSRFLPLWWGPWFQGPHSSLHDGYLDRAIGVGIPATLLWLFIVLRPWVALFRRRDDDWGLKPVALWLVLPLLVHNLAETSINDGIGAAGLAFVTAWALAERYRMKKRAQDRIAERQTNRRLAPAVAAMAGVLTFTALLCLTALPDNAHGTESATYTSAEPVYFSTLPPHAQLPGAAWCAAEVQGASRELRPDNYAANHTVPNAAQLAAFHERPVKGTFAPREDFARVNGDFTGTTDQILRWAACKWGIDENVVRAEAAAESHWYQNSAGDPTSDRSLCPPGFGFVGAWNGSECDQSYGILQMKFKSFGGWPLSKDSTAFNADFRFAYQRACMNGDINYLARRIPSPGYPRYPDGSTSQMLWGCIGDWFSGSWFDAGALRYIAAVKVLAVQKPWLGADSAKAK